jgi:hypothetical protein
VQIIVKVRADRTEQAEERLSQAVPAPVRGRASVSRVFPARSAGDRARLYSIDLPPDLSADAVQSLVEALRADPDLEYANLPAPRRPL